MVSTCESESNFDVFKSCFNESVDLSIAVFDATSSASVNLVTVLIACDISRLIFLLA